MGRLVYALALSVVLAPACAASDAIPPTFCANGIVVYGVPCPPEQHSEPAGGGAPMAPDSSGPSYDSYAPPPPPAPEAMPPAAAADPPIFRGLTSTGSSTKVLSYFQRARTRLDTSRAFGFVLLPRAAVTADETRVQLQFCEILLASMDFMTPGAAAARGDVLATYWPVVGERESFEIKAAFEDRNCQLLLAWYDHGLARTLAAKAGVGELSGPLLITWPSGGDSYEGERDPLVVDFSRADYGHATKTLQYWFRQLRHRPELWTDRIREGTIRAELADAINDSAGVMLAVLYGKWDTLSAVNASP